MSIRQLMPVGAHRVFFDSTPFSFALESRYGSLREKIVRCGGLRQLALQAAKGRQRGQQFLAVSLAQQAIIQDGHPAVVGFGADQPAHGLNQLDLRFWHGDFDERVAAARFNPLRQRLPHRVVRHGERQLGQNHLHAGFTGQVQPFGK